MKDSIIKLALATTISFTLINCSGGSKSTPDSDAATEKTESSSTTAIKDPVELNNTIMLAINELQKDQKAMNTAMIAQDYTKVEEIRSTWSKNLDNTIDKISKIEASGAGSEFKKSVLKSLDTYKDIVNNKYVELIDIRKNNGDANKDVTLLSEINEGLANTQNEVNEASSNFQEKVTDGETEE
ncbi:hypothetical protein [Chryseobacterium sp.]|uniref:LIC11966 family surface protein n=1 Tax=Chryseobacterium sp. TaxID=1871047 RepID=UPI0025B8161B|nr:hypothetical protein [Chryseobacterium sp.]